MQLRKQQKSKTKSYRVARKQVKRNSTWARQRNAMTKITKEKAERKKKAKNKHLEQYEKVAGDLINASRKDTQESQVGIVMLTPPALRRVIVGDHKRSLSVALMRLSVVIAIDFDSDAYKFCSVCILVAIRTYTVVVVHLLMLLI